MVKKKIVKKAPEQAAPAPQSGESEQSIAAQLHEQGGFCIQLCERAAAQANGSLEEALGYLMEHMDDDKELCESGCCAVGQFTCPGVGVVLLPVLHCA